MDSFTFPCFERHYLKNAAYSSGFIKTLIGLLLIDDLRAILLLDRRLDLIRIPIQIGYKDFCSFFLEQQHLHRRLYI
jgi:hypothetical protein